MRVLITASGIQDYIFDISQRAASARLRGRSARLGLVLDHCLQRFRQKFGNAPEVKRNAGSRLELEFAQTPSGLHEFLADLQRLLDEYSRTELDGQVWFAVAQGSSRGEAYNELARAKLSMGQRSLQRQEETIGRSSWNEERFLFRSEVNERELGKDAARELPEAVLGRDLARPSNRYIQFKPTQAPGQCGLRILDHFAEVSQTDPGGGFRWVLEEIQGAADSNVVRKHLARYAPLGDNRGLLDLDEIAGKSTGAEFLGVLKADVDNLASAFEKISLNGKATNQLSEQLDALFTDGLENLIKTGGYLHSYIVYAGGDDLFVLGPWDQLIRLIASFHSLVEQSVATWGYPQLTLSAGFKLAHPKSPVRYLAEDVETALNAAKGHHARPTSLPPKNRIAVFERVLAWEELEKGVEWADYFINGVKTQNLSAGFLQRMQYFADQFRQFEEGHIDGLRMVPLLQDDWRRNIGRVVADLRKKLDEEVKPLLVEPSQKGGRMWRIMDFASRFAIYALR